MRKWVLVILTVVLLSFAATYVASANAASYDVVQVGKSYVGDPWTFRATTNDLGVDKVTFAYSFSPLSASPPSWSDFPSMGKNVDTVSGSLSFESTVKPDQPGHYSVSVAFWKGGVAVGSWNHDEEILQFGLQQTVPEVPVVGTVGIIIVMLIALLFIRKRGSAK